MRQGLWAAVAAVMLCAAPAASAKVMVADYTGVVSLMFGDGTLFAPTEQRKPDGHGFTHMVGDLVSIRSPKLGTLSNRVNHCDKITPWTFGVSALMRNLAARGLLK